MENIPTAGDFWLSKRPHLSHAQIAIEFAKLHVEAALKSASEQVDLTDESYNSMQEGSVSDIDKNTILFAYPLENIK